MVNWTTIARVMSHNLMRCAQRFKVAKRGSSKQSNEILAATDDRCPSARGLTGRDRVRPNRDEFVEAQEHAANVLGLDEKVSDGVRRALKRFSNSPLTYWMEVLNDPEQAQDRRMDAASRLTPFLHRKLEDVHGAQKEGSGAGSGASAGQGSAQHGLRGPTINLHVNRPSAPSVVVNQQVASAPVEAPQAAQEQPKEQEAKPTQPKVFKKPKGRAK